MKYIGLGFGFPKIKIFNHKKYTRKYMCGYKSGAIAEANAWRDTGHLARVVGTTGNYAVYVR